MTKDELLAMVAGSAEQQTGSTEAAEDSDMSWKNALKKAADDGDEDAKKALAALEDDDEDAKKNEGEKKPDGDPPPPADDDKKKADDAGDEDDDEDTDQDEDKMSKKSSKSGKASKASAATSVIVELSRTVNKLHASVSAIEKSKVDAERKAIFDARPDLAANANMKRKEHPILAIARKTASLDDVRAMLDAIPVDKRNLGAAASQATGTSGASQPSVVRELSSADEAHIDRMMGLTSTSHNKVRSTGSSLELGYLTPDQARARVAELDRELNKKESV